MGDPVVFSEALGSFDGGVLLVPMELDGRSLTAVIDWGAFAQGLGLRVDGAAVPIALRSRAPQLAGEQIHRASTSLPQRAVEWPPGEAPCRAAARCCLL